MNTITRENPALAAQFYGLITPGQPQQFLDFLIDHPGERFDSEVLQRELQFPQHKDVALAAYSIGESAAALGLDRPWTEGQLGYQMSPEIAESLANARTDL